METTKLNDESLRNYFAAHAPTCVPEWFAPKLTPIPVRPENSGFCEGCKAGADCEKTLPCLAAQEWNKKTAKVRDLNKEEKFFQWRAYYADMMIATMDDSDKFATLIADAKSLVSALNKTKEGTLGVFPEYYALSITLDSFGPLANGKSPLAFADAIKIAKGCFDYSGGYGEMDRAVFHHGIQTVINALEAAKTKGLADTQVNILHKIGSK